MERADHQPLLLLYYWCSKSFGRRQAGVAQLLIEMLYFIHFEWKKHRVWYRIPWSCRASCFQRMESLERSRVSDVKNLNSEGSFFYKTLSGLLTASSQPPQVLSSSWGLLQVFLYPIFCTNYLSTALWKQCCGIVISVLPPARMY